MWVVRAGKKAVYYDKYLRDEKIYIPWEGYNLDLSQFKTYGEFKELVIKEKGDNKQTSISNWTTQLFSFVREMRKDDYVLIPSEFSRTYCLAKITSEYGYDKSDDAGLCHSRKVKIIEKNIPRETFEQNIIYSLGAYRTIFHVKYEKEVIDTINEWRKNR